MTNTSCKFADFAQAREADGRLEESQSLCLGDWDLVFLFFLVFWGGGPLSCSDRKLMDGWRLGSVGERVGTVTEKEKVMQISPVSCAGTHLARLSTLLPHKVFVNHWN